MGLESPRINATVSGTTTATVVNADDLEVDSGTLSVDADNNRVGVGTTSPQVSLDVIGIGSFAGAEASLSQGNVQVGVDSGGAAGGELMYHTDDYIGLRCADSGTVSLAVKPDGKVGIGTTAPAQVLDVIGIGSFALAEASLSQGNIQVGVDSGGDPGGELMYHTDDYVGLRCADSGALSLAVKPSGNVGIGDVAPGTQLQMTGTAPYVTLKNSTSENSDRGCETKIIFEDHADNALGQIEVSHVGSSDDEKGQLILSTNNDSGLQTALTIDEAQQVIIPDGKLVLASTAITSTAAELNYVDGVTSNIQTQLDAKSAVAGSNSLTTTGALNSGSITSGFGSIDVGSSTITTTGSITAGTVDINSAIGDEAASGIVASFTAGEALSRGEVVYFKAADSKMWKAVATAQGTARCVAMAAEDISADASGKFLLQGFLQDNGTFPAYTVGGTLYTPEAETSGENVPEQTAPDTDGDFVQVIGWAVTANTVYFSPSMDIIEVA